MENDLKQQNTEFAKQALNNLENLKMTIQFNISKNFYRSFERVSSYLTSSENHFSHMSFRRFSEQYDSCIIYCINIFLGG